MINFVAKAQSSEEEIVDVPFQVYVWPGGPMASVGEHPRGGGYTRPIIEYSPDGVGEAVDIMADELRLSSELHYRGPNPLQFYREITLANGEKRRKLLASVVIPVGMKRALLLFFPVKGKSYSYDVFPIDNSLERVPLGQSQVYNLTQSKIACLFNEQQLLIERGQSLHAKLGPAEDFTVLVRIGAEDDAGQWKVRHEQRLVVNPEDSSTTLIYMKPGSRKAYRILVLKNSEMKRTLSPAISDAD
ncbi:hypothetical protein SH580_03365 [Coraliomargarita algicola]|uniref:DUF4138 domain-containing protein n=1 Tax=Coraliomargarita algicola TaxID=3092156 RepID=A0ABZ0RNR1_9BACT|nr:hypothetical protein [Coraliomargarita sp. J2-16]WPJ96743.1 hypothetical protein SH580_03365 [Coraliomargarita sp. J2-16]